MRQIAFWRGAARLLLGLAVHGLAFAMAVVLTVLVFLLLPLMQSIATAPKDKFDVRAISGANLEAPPPPPEQELEKEEPEPETAPELTETAQPLDLSQLELALNPGTGGGDGGGDFEVKLFTTMNKRVADEESDALCTMTDLDQPPRPVYQTPPEYPAELKQKKIQGSVLILFVVDRQGRVMDPKVQKSTHPAFEGPAMRAIRRWRFEPGSRNGSPVQFKMRIPITFAL